MPERPFDRTECSCAECVSCCTRQPGSLIPGELERIAAYLHKPVSAVLARFWASPGALVQNRYTGKVFSIGTITPRLKAGRCVFLSPEDRCTIHPVAPTGCACFDTHMSAEEGQRRAQWVARQQQDPEYQSLRRALQPAATHNPVGFEAGAGRA